MPSASNKLVFACISTPAGVDDYLGRVMKEDDRRISL